MAGTVATTQRSDQPLRISTLLLGVGELIHSRWPLVKFAQADAHARKLPEKRTIPWWLIVAASGW